MATKKQKTIVRVAVYFANGKGAPYDLDPVKDKLVEGPKKLEIHRGNETKAVTKFNYDHIAFYNVSRLKVDVDSDGQHPAMRVDEAEDGIDLL